MQRLSQRMVSCEPFRFQIGQPGYTLWPSTDCMPRSLLLPFPPLRILAQEGLITWAWLKPVIRGRLDEGISLCVTADAGDTNRGGYFFHLRKTAAGFEFAAFDRPGVLILGTGEECAAFMNHVSGRRYDEDMWRLCQSVNLRRDAG